jgi:putative integral membrane protein (TIGR02587 family)
MPHCWTVFCFGKGMNAPNRAIQGIWSREFDDLIRGAAGGFLFGIPLLYTMEVWWLGSFTHPERMLVALLTTFVAVLLLNRTAGFRHSTHVSLLDAAIDSIEALAIGLICVSIMLLLLREITLETPLDEVLGKIIFESVPFALGVALANQFLYRIPSDSPDQTNGRQPNDEQAGPQQGTHTEHQMLWGTIADIGATIIGAIIIAFNIAPTDEIPMLAAAVSPPWLLLIMLASLIISYGIVFEANFADQQKREQQPGIFQQPISETIASYLVALLAAAFMLWFFQQLSFDDPWTMWLSHTLLLGLPATVGGAAGRLAI